MAAMSPPDANAVFDVLAEFCAAQEHHRRDLVAYLTHSYSFHEYRFMGSLGSGGKLYWDGRNTPRVGCYSEDDTDERLDAIIAANNRLIQLFIKPVVETPKRPSTTERKVSE